MRHEAGVFIFYSYMDEMTVLLRLILSSVKDYFLFLPFCLCYVLMLKIIFCFLNFKKELLNREKRKLILPEIMLRAD